MADREYWPDFLLEHGTPPCPGRPHPNNWLAPLPSPLVGEGRLGRKPERGEGVRGLEAPSPGSPLRGESAPGSSPGQTLSHEGRGEAARWRVGTEDGDHIAVGLGGILRFHWREPRGVVHASVHPDGTYELHETPAGDANAFDLVGSAGPAFDSPEAVCASFAALDSQALLSIAAWRCSVEPEIFRLAPRADGGAALLPIGGDSRRDLRQAQVAEWIISRFGAKIFLDVRERLRRLIEEALELVQAEGLSFPEVMAIAAHVYDRPPGEPQQELGGLGITLLGYAAARGLSAEAAEAQELSRIAALPAGHFRARQDAKALAGLARACEEAA